MVEAEDGVRGRSRWGWPKQVRLPVHSSPASRACGQVARPERRVAASLFPCPRPQRGGLLSTPAVWALHLSVSPGAVREKGSSFPVWNLAFLGD